MAVEIYQPGNAIILTEQFLDPRFFPPRLVDPDSAAIDLFDPDKIQIVTAQALTRISLGIWQFIYQSDTSDGVGVWTQVITVSRGSFVNIKKSPSFILSVDPVA